PLPGSRGLDLRRDPAGAPLRPSLTRAFAYSDCRVDDARLVVLNAVDAAERGAEVLTRTALVGARRVDGLWHATLGPAPGGAERRLRARALVNAAGPWVAEVEAGRLGHVPAAPVRLVKGS